VSKIVFEKYPGAANLGTGDDARAGASAQFLRVTTKERCCFVEPEGLHALARS
jgi:hypothetical protein